jgi:anti-sigma-K factor RskA
MNCEEVRELLPAYVLGALENAEVNEVEAHLRSGHEHDDELAELRLTVFALDRFADEASLEVAEAPRRERLALLQRPKEWLRSASSLASRPAWGLALAAVIVLAVFASGWLVARMTEGGSGQNVSLLVQGPGGETVSLDGGSSQENVRVTMGGLQRLPSGRVYELWAIRNGDWMRIGVCNTDAEGAWRGKFPFTISPGDRIAVTVEPAGGSNGPTSTPLLISNS